MQLNAQLYYACTSLQRPLEDNRLEFQHSGLADAAKDNRALNHGDSQNHGKTSSTIRVCKRKHRDDGECEPNPRRRFQCVHCGNKDRSFFDHGFKGHLWVVSLSSHSESANAESHCRKAKHAIDVEGVGFEIGKHALLAASGSSV